MVYYHGSKELFKEFDLSKCKNNRLCLTPHLEYAKQFGEYIYVINVKGSETLEYKEWMSNITFASLENIQIIDVLNNKTTLRNE